MSKLKWFSGGNERSEEAIVILNKLITSMDKDTDAKTFERLLISYRDELLSKQISVPFVLSRMNIEISQFLIENKLSMSEVQVDLMRDLRKLSNIRYGY